MTTNATVAIAQGSRQRGDDFARAAARILAELIAEFVSSFPANALVAVVRTVDESRHDLWIADAAVLVAQLVQRTFALTSIAGGLRRVDQACDFAGVIFAALGATAAVGVFVAASIGIVAAGVGIVAAAIAGRSRTARTTGRWCTARLRTARSRAVRGTVVTTAVVRTSTRRSGARRSTGRRSGTGWSTRCGSSARRSAIRSARSSTVRSTVVSTTVVATGIAWSGAARIATLLAAA